MTTPGALAPQRWHRLIPLAFVTYSLAYVDRSNYSLGAAGGPEHSLHITSAETGLLGGLFLIGYFLFQVLAASFAERRRVKTLMFWSLLGWGVFAAAQGLMKEVKVRRAYDPPARGDGARVLVDRTWPRGLTKVKAHLDEWCKDVAPSTELRKWYSHDPARFAEFTRRYHAELKEPGRSDALVHLRE